MQISRAAFVTICREHRPTISPSSTAWAKGRAPPIGMLSRPAAGSRVASASRSIRELPPQRPASRAGAAVGARVEARTSPKSPTWAGRRSPRSTSLGTTRRPQATLAGRPTSPALLALASARMRAPRRPSILRSPRCGISMRQDSRPAIRRGERLRSRRRSTRTWVRFGKPPTRPMGRSCPANMTSTATASA